MKLPLSWLKEYVDINLPLEELCHRLTMAGLETAPAEGGRVLEAEVTPNRPDWLSVLGVAWEIAALSGATVRLPQVGYEEQGAPIAESVEIAIPDPDLCHRYSASLVKGVRVGPSPRWMQERLLAAGMRPINNIVDITNYVMLEYGQPLHAFDWDKLQEGQASTSSAGMPGGLGGVPPQFPADSRDKEVLSGPARRVIIRRARPGERLATLDGVERTLSPDMLVIADARDPIAAAGIMGGADSEVSEATTNVLLESANFYSRSIRRTSQRLGLRTEASIRFERGISAELTLPALRRATQMFLELAGGQAAQGVVDLYPVEEDRPQIGLSQEDLGRTLGVDWTLAQARQALESLGFACREEPGGLRVGPPAHRTDIRLMEDVVEEVARIVGYEAIPSTALRGPLPEPREDPLRELEDTLRDILVGYGLQDVITYTLVSAQSLERARFSAVEPIRLANPMSREQEYLRPTLRPNLLSGLATNQRFGEEGAWLFEVGRVFRPREADLPEERRVVCAAIYGPRGETSWAEKAREVDFYDAKGLVEGIFGHLGVEAGFEPLEDPFFTPGRAALIRDGSGVVLGTIGEVSPLVRDAFELQARPVGLFELDLECLLPHSLLVRRFRELPRYPPVSQDLSILVDQEVPAARLEELIKAFPLVARVAVFDVFTGGQLPPGKRSLSFSILYHSPERTLTGEEVAQVHRQIVERLEQALGATLRS